MRKVLACACGVVLTAFGEDDLLTCVEEHLAVSHGIPAPPESTAGSPGRETNEMGEGEEPKRIPHLVTCGCGHEIWSEDAEELLAAVEAHIRQSHPELIGTLSPLELAQKENPGKNGVAA
jgi:predicted small metal-binding protein